VAAYGVARSLSSIVVRAPVVTTYSNEPGYSCAKVNFRYAHASRIECGNIQRATHSLYEDHETHESDDELHGIATHAMSQLHSWRLQTLPNLDIILSRDAVPAVPCMHRPLYGRGTPKKGCIPGTICGTRLRVLVDPGTPRGFDGRSSSRSGD